MPLSVSFGSLGLNSANSSTKSEVTLLTKGGCPQRADVVIANNTKYELDLDLNESCGRECDHKGDFNTFLYIYNR